jgi:hypothetical protein
MKSNNITGSDPNTLRHNAVKFAGFMFILAFVVPALNWAFILSKFIVADDTVATGKNIMDNEFLFRIGISIELLMSIGLIILGVILYSLLKSVNKIFSLLALSLKLVEAALAVTITLGSLVALLAIIEHDAYLTKFDQEPLLALAGFMLHNHTVLYAVPMVFLGLDMMLFSYLFLKSRYIPRLLAGFGIFSFALILIHAIMYLITPHYAAMPINQIIFWAPSGLFEIIIGLWLMLKGMDATADVDEKRSIPEKTRK